MSYWITNIIVSQHTLPELQDRRCMACGSLLFKSNRGILAIWMGEGYPARLIPLGMGWVSIKCRRCEMLYNLYYQ